MFILRETEQQQATATKLHISYTNRDNHTLKLLVGTKTRVPAKVEHGDTVEKRR